ncbi:MAG: DUF2837 family protein [Peptococcaceae bacterium]|nr:DUF2837 family protein [Peptococcaceae bacterium]
MPTNLAYLLGVTLIIHVIDTLAYAVRLNSVKSGRFALSVTLFNLFYLISLLAHTLQSPLIGSLIDSSLSLSLDPLPQLRQIIVAATVGTLLGIALTPTFLQYFSRAVLKLERVGSVPSIVVEALKIRNLRGLLLHLTIPNKNMVSCLSFWKVPKELLALNALVTGIYTIGGMAAYYAATLVTADHRLTAAASAGIFNTLANIVFMLFIDPKSSIITDQALRGNRSYADVKALVIILMSAKLLGTLLGQLLLLPLARAIAAFYG